jgi:hypothetical protein
LGSPHETEFASTKTRNFGVWVRVRVESCTGVGRYGRLFLRFATGISIVLSFDIAWASAAKVNALEARTEGQIHFLVFRSPHLYSFYPPGVIALVGLGIVRDAPVEPEFRLAPYK